MEVQFNVVESGFVTIFIRPVEDAEFSSKTVEKKVTEKVTENQKKIMEAIIINPNITTNELSRFVGISSRKIKENIAKLKAKNLLKRIGPAKGGHGKLLKNDL